MLKKKKTQKKEEGEMRRWRRQRKIEEEEMEGRWSRTTWSGEATVARDLKAGE